MQNHEESFHLLRQIKGLFKEQTKQPSGPLSPQPTDGPSWVFRFYTNLRKYEGFLPVQETEEMQVQRRG